MSDGNLTARSKVRYREIARFPGYRFGSDGSFWSRWKKVGIGNGRGSKTVLGDSWTILEGYIEKRGYRKVWLRTSDRPKGHTIHLHRLILEAFRGPCPPGLEACHKPHVPKSSCRLEDLRWDTHPANIADKVADGTKPEGERHGMAKLTWEKVDRIRHLHDQGMTYPAIAKRFGVYHGNIAKICRGELWNNRP